MEINVDMILNFTEKAILARIGKLEEWFPKSQIQDCPNDEELSELKRKQRRNNFYSPSLVS